MRHVLDLVSSSKYLEVTLNDHLTWNEYIQNMVTSANKTLGFLRRNVGSLSTHLLFGATTPNQTYIKQRWYRGELLAGLCVVSLIMIVFQTCWVILGGGLLRIGVQTQDYVCFIRLCKVLLQCHFNHMLCLLRCLKDIQHHIR